MSTGLCQLAFVLFSVSAVLSAAPLASASESRWIEIQSPYFSVVTDAGEKRGQETATRVE